MFLTLRANGKGMGKDNTVRHSFSPDSGVKNLRGLVALFEDILIDGGKRRIGVLGKFKPVVGRQQNNPAGRAAQAGGAPASCR